ncbi:MAG: MmgE/PrpD family protein [Acidimicrobiia bacterium]|nr:MmgE/PrpD family protein [Acidimicrobiia bacterium]
MLTALAVGCDLVCRLGLALEEDPATHGWYPPAILQPFGAAAGAARVLGLDDAVTLDALSLTLAQVTGTAEMTTGARSLVRGVRDGFGAHAGVLAAQLASHGVHGFDRPFEGDVGLFALYAGGLSRGEVLLDQLGERFEGAHLGYKLWPSCRGTHAAIAASLELRERGIVAETITDIVVVGSSLNRMLCEPREQRIAPRTAIDAKFSLPFTVARAIVHGTVGLDAFSAESLADPQVRQVAARVRYAVDENDGPGAATRCRLELTTDGGDTHRIVVDAAPGGAGTPMSDEVLEAKFRANAAHSVVPLTAGAIDAIVAAVASLDQSADVGHDLLDLLRADV